MSESQREGSDVVVRQSPDAADEGTDVVEGGGESDVESPSRRFVLGIIGDSGSGKDTVADAVVSLLGTERITDMRLDDYRRYSREERLERELSSLNPEVHDFDLMEEHLGLLRSGRPVRIRHYDHRDGTFGSVRTIESREIVLVRGPFGVATEGLATLHDLSVFLQPEPDLLFRWKLRRDTLFRGYSEAQVLKHIANHLLDSKEYVLPQAERVDLLVSYQLPDWEAPDAELITTLRLRRRAAEIASSTCLFGGLPMTTSTEDGEVVVTIPPAISADEVASWGRTRFPSFDAGLLGSYVDESGTVLRRPSLALVEVLIAQLCTEMAAAAPAG